MTSPYIYIMRKQKSKPIVEEFITIFGVAFILVFWLAFLKYVLPYMVSYNMFGTEYKPLGKFVFMCLLAPLWEELAFRHAPFLIVEQLKSKLKVDITIPCIILTSVLFGWGHGNGVISLLIQGIGGFFLSMVYLRSRLKYWGSVTMHFVWNFSLVYIFPVFAATYGITL